MPEKDTQQTRPSDDPATNRSLFEEDDPSGLLRLLLHELRNPLGIATGHLELAQADCDSEHLDSVAQALDRMESLVDEFGTISETGQIIDERHSVSLRTVIEDSWKAVSSEQASLVVDSTCQVHADPSRLQQVLENLLRNAVDHGGDDVTITIGDLPDDPGFYFEDDGPGISPENYEIVFERGYTTRTGGTGFGLWLVDKLVAAHGWDITVTRGSTGGTRFEIRTGPT